MTSQTCTLLVPNALGATVAESEQLYSLADAVPPADQYTLDMLLVDFVNPSGVLALVTTARLLSSRSRCPVQLENLPTQIYLYLQRMNVFDVGCNWLRPHETLEEQWAHNPQTTNLLELTTITGPQTVATVLERAERIFSRWLRPSSLGNLLSVLSELCANVYEHSGDPQGCVLMQKYDVVTRGQIALHLSVGDLGCGIRRSLMARYGESSADQLDYLRQAMQGRTARSSGRGGLGLRLVEEIARAGDGYLWLRSETAALFRSKAQASQEMSDLVFVPGTQVAVKLYVRA
jgi:anti-sigma regulatory factor (Ser/Thr protein kinase)